MTTPWWKRPLLFPASSGRYALREDVAVGDVLADVYTPESRERRPAVLFIHGGPIAPGQQMKNLPFFRDYGRLLAGEGFVAATFNHRYFAANDFAQSAADVRAVIDFVRGDPAVDPDRLVLWAFSGGGPLLALGFDDPSICALVDFYAVLEGPLPFSPLARAGEIRVPMLIARAGRDLREVNEPLRQFLDAALAGDVAVELLNHPAGEHAFDIVTDDARTRQIIGRTLTFLRDVTVELEQRNPPPAS